MSAHLGFVLRGAAGNGIPNPVIDWTHQPLGRGYAAKPVAEDSAIVTVQIRPRFIGPAFGQGFADDVFANIVWNAAGEAQLEAEVDVWPGVAFSLAATSVKVAIGWTISGQNPIGGPLLHADATIGRGSRPGDGGLTRTRTVGAVAGGATSATQTIPPFARALSVVTRTSPPTYSVRIRQFSGATVVQVDDLVGPAFGARALVHRSADSFDITNLLAGAANFLVPFHLSFL